MTIRRTYPDGTVVAFDVLDEDNMASNSATAVPTQQSVKAYADAVAAAAYATTTTSGVIELATQAEVDAGTSTDRAVTPSTLANYSGLGGGGGATTLDGLSDVTAPTPADAQVLAWNAPNNDWRPTTFLTGSGVTRNTHTHSSAGALSIPRAAADQATVVTISANATSWTDNLTTDLDHLLAHIVSDGLADYTLDLSNILTADGNLGTIPVFPGTKLELHISRIAGEPFGVLKTWRVGTSANITPVSVTELHTDDGSSTNARAFAYPAGIQENDLVRIVVASSGASDPGASTATNYTQRFTSAWSAFRPRVTILDRVAPSGGLSGSFTVNTSPTNTNRSSVILQVFRGVDTAASYSGTPTEATSVDTVPDASAITTLDPNALALVYIGTKDDVITQSDEGVDVGTIAGYTEFGDAAPSATRYGIRAFYKAVATAGVENPPANTNGAAVSNWTSVTDAIKP